MVKERTLSTRYGAVGMMKGGMTQEHFGFEWLYTIMSLQNKTVFPFSICVRSINIEL